MSHGSNSRSISRVLAWEHEDELPQYVSFLVSICVNFTQEDISTELRSSDAVSQCPIEECFILVVWNDRIQKLCYVHLCGE